jgi:hypothetical protein
MGNATSRVLPVVERAVFDDLNDSRYLVISVLSETEQDVLIQGTVACGNEVAEVEKAIQAKRVIIIYGRNNHDDRVWLKYAQLKKLGGKAKVYIGGLFEWILLQELYGNERFPLTSAKFDPYQYSPK